MSLLRRKTARKKLVCSRLIDKSLASKRADVLRTCVLLIAFYGCLSISAPTHADDKSDIWVGVAKVDVTPTVPVVLAGYGGRTKPYETIETNLWARAMVIGKKDPVAIVVLDNCGVTREITERVRTLLATKGFRKVHVNVAATHTHNAPNLTGYAPILWQGRMSQDQIEATNKYTQFAVEKMAEAVSKAKETAFLAKLSWGQGRVTFGGNRRVISDGKWAGFGFQWDAPVDHSLPVLVARDRENQVRAVWANYACHCTTLGSKNSVAGDWAGFANDGIESRFPKATSLVSIGCGADVGPQPSGSSVLAKKHGEELALEVKRLVDKNDLSKISSLPKIRSTTIQLKLQKPKPISHWEKLAQSRSFDKQLAIKMLAENNSNGKIADSVEYPIQTWAFGDELAIVFLPGEVVVDYAVRLKTELDWKRIWITAWTNRMPGYIPSRKVLMQGGYEADFSQVYYGLPGRYLPEIEDLIVRNIRDIVGPSFKNPPEHSPSPFHRPPSREEVTMKKFRATLETIGPSTKRYLREIRNLIPIAQPAMDALSNGMWRQDHWYNLYGDRVKRAFIRQEKVGESISWKSPKISDGSKGVFCFTAGLGWISQPESKGFEFEVNGDSATIDVVQKPTKWTSTGKSFQLYYLPTWTSNEDSAGFFIVSLRDLPLKSQSVKMSVRSLSSGSQRWFGLDVKQNVKIDAEKLLRQLKSIGAK